MTVAAPPHEPQRWTEGRHAFQRSLGEAFAPLLLSAPPGFRGRVSPLHSARLSLTRVEATRHAVVRPADDDNAPRAACYKLIVQLSGAAEVRQHGRQAVCMPGWAALYDLSQPYSLEFAGDDNDTLVLLIDHRDVGRPVTAVRQLTARPIRDDHGLGAIVLPMIRAFAQSAEELSGPVDGAVGDHVRDMTALLLAHEAWNVTGTGGDLARKAQLFDEVCGYVEEHLTDPALSPPDIAAAHFMSVRSLHALFRARGLTAAGHLREQRLLRIRRDLTDPRYLCRTIAEVAAMSGLVDAAHFSRLFSARFGESASAYRTRMLRAAAPRALA